jgi:hypothetical protein
MSPVMRGDHTAIGKLPTARMRKWLVDGPCARTIEAQGSTPSPGGSPRDHSMESTGASGVQAVSFAVPSRP